MREPTFLNECKREARKREVAKQSCKHKIGQRHGIELPSQLAPLATYLLIMRDQDNFTLHKSMNEPTFLNECKRGSCKSI